MKKNIKRQFFPLALLLGFAAYGYYGDGLNDGFASMSFSEMYSQVSDAAPQLNGSFDIPRL